MSDELDLTKLETPELIDQMKDDLYDGLADHVVAGVNELLRRKMTPHDVLTKALVAGMDAVGVDFRDGVLFVPEVLMAAKSMKAGMEILRPKLAESGAPQIGTMLVGTVKGDIHDIGKNLVAMMMEGAGFKVVNLGINIDADAFVAAVREHKPAILGLSALLTTTMPEQRRVIEGLSAKGARGRVKVIVGGAPVSAAWAAEIGADGFAESAPAAAALAERLVAG